ncbi:MAG: hypothetical protein K2N06_04695 [Oscillospiraceae bacterium]|nr:hypothetical protein [Oscillospiraceae bacterium]
MEKTQLKRLKQLIRSELLEVMLALKRENDILMMENLRLKTIKHKLEHDLQEITDTLERIERSTYDADYQAESAQDGAWQEYGAFESTYKSVDAVPVEENVEPSFESVFDSYADEVTNR